MVTAYHRPQNLDEALALLESEPDARLLAGGTSIMGPQFRDTPLALISIGRLLPSAIEARDSVLRIGAGASFQELADSPHSSPALKAACLGMANRNVRNRATVGGNIGSRKSCASLLPFFLAADGHVERHGAPDMEIGEWLGIDSPVERGIVRQVVVPLPAGRRFGYSRWSRVACDIALLGCAVSCAFSPRGEAAGMRIAMGGLAGRARRFPEIEALFGGKKLPPADWIVEAAAPLLNPVGDLRGSAEFKRKRAAILLAEAIGSLGARTETETEAKA